MPFLVTWISYASAVGLPAASTNALEPPRVMKMDCGPTDFPVTTGAFKLRVESKSAENVSENSKSVGGINVSPRLLTEF